MEPITAAPAPADTPVTIPCPTEPPEPAKSEKAKREFNELDTLKRLGTIFDSVPNSQVAERIFQWLCSYVTEKFGTDKEDVHPPHINNAEIIAALRNAD